MDQTTGYNKMTLGTASTPARATRNDETSIDEIRQNIEKSRSEITDTVDQLGERLKQSVDWRSYIGDYPLVAVGGAALIGFYLSRKLFAPKRSTTEELVQKLIKTGVDAISPKKQGITMAALTLAGKYALDQFQKYQHEAEQAKQQEEQLQALQAYQQMLAQQMSGGVDQYPVEQRHRSVGGEY